MLSDIAKECHEYFMSQMAHVFGDTMELVETRGSYDWHLYFFIKYWYKPAKLFVKIESQSWLFTIRLEQEDGCFAHLYQIQRFANKMTVDNIEKAIYLLKSVIERPITFYKSTGDGYLYRKEGDKFIRLSREELSAYAHGNTGNSASDNRNGD